ncbi:MAG: zinc ribbon domain-containing protein [Bacteroidales bacterium]|nr:zinc ribbon domain-containing protein [Bacteroidales bacterium]MCF8404581.1 zinc ribbon domain-containing protein [Bacteroidales bacterium]
MQTYKNCQSCGMPLNKDSNKGGTETDGTKTEKFCSHCYDKGKFTRPEITADEMKALVKGQLKKMGFPGFIAGFFTKNIPKLERWKNN